MKGIAVSCFFVEVPLQVAASRAAGECSPWGSNSGRKVATAVDVFLRGAERSQPNGWNSAAGKMHWRHLAVEA